MMVFQVVDQVQQIVQCGFDVYWFVGVGCFVYLQKEWDYENQILDCGEGFDGVGVFVCGWVQFEDWCNVCQCQFGCGVFGKQYQYDDKCQYVVCIVKGKV